jgi:LysM repeat protein
MLRWLLFDDTSQRALPRRGTPQESERTFGWRMRTYDYTFLGGADDADDVCEERPRISRREGTSYGTFLEETILSLSSTAGQVEENETDSDELELELKSRPATLNPEEMRWRVHLVQTGETLAGLALHYGLTVEDIKRANGLAGDSFGVKMEVNIPKQSGVTSATEVYRMVRFSSFFYARETRAARWGFQANAWSSRKSRHIRSQCTARAIEEEEWYARSTHALSHTDCCIVYYAARTDGAFCRL